MPKSPQGGTSNVSALRLLAVVIVVISTTVQCYRAGCPPHQWFLCLACLAIELSAVKLPAQGYFSYLAVLVLAASASPTVGPSASICLILIAVWTRLIFRSDSELRKNGLIDHLGESLILIPMAACSFIPAPLPTEYHWVFVLLIAALQLLWREVVYQSLAVRLEPSEREQWSTISGQLHKARITGCIVTPAVFVLTQWSSYGWALTLPTLLFMQQLVSEQLSSFQATRELEALETLSRESASTRPLVEYFRLGLRIIGRVVTAQSLVFFAGSSSKTVQPVCWSTPYSRRLEDSSTMEPIVEIAARGREISSHSPEISGRRIFPEEQVAVALPIGNFGVLYVGRVETPFTVAEHAFFMNFTQRLNVALILNQQRLNEEKTLVDLSRSKQALQQEVHLLASLLEGTRQLSTSLNSEQLLKALQQLVERNIRHTGGQVWLSPSGPALSWGNNQADARAIVESVVGSGQPQATTQNGYSSLCVPISCDSQVIGAILLQAQFENAFNLEQQQFLWALSYSLGAALTNAQLFSDVVRARQELEHSQVQLVHSSKLNAIGELAAGVAHEINSPLGAIVGTLELVSEQLGPQQPKALQRLDRARQAALRAQKIVSKLLVYSRQSPSQPTRLSLHTLVSDTLELFGPMWASKGVQIKSAVAEDVAALGKANELQQVLVNLVNNAIEATAGLDVERRIITISGYWDEERPLLTVNDQGCGIPRENLENIFQPFVTTKEPGSGTGLGLSLSTQILAGMNAHLAVESVVGQGSTFRIELPSPQ